VNWPLIAFWILLAVVAGSTAYSCIALVAVRQFWRMRRRMRGEVRSASHAPPVSILKPLYGPDRELRENLESFCRQDYPAYEILFSVREESDVAVPVVRQLERDFPRVPMRLLFTGQPPYPNAKVHALEVLMEAASHELLVINDSGVRVEPKYLQSVVRPFAEPATGLVTCIARSMPARGFWSLLEALGINTQFNPGVLTAWLLLGMQFSIGKTMAIRKQLVRQLGGFGSLGKYLADDFVLGERVMQAGHTVVLSEAVPDNLLADAGMRGSLAHRLRWERSSRRSRPAGYLGQIFLHNLPLAALAWACAPAESLFASALIAACIGTRVLLAWACAGGLLRDPMFRGYAWLLPVQDFVSFGVWLWAFFGREIVWRGHRFRVGRGGVLKPVDR
jgi:ceramide glucosyltransferase